MHASSSTHSNQIVIITGMHRSNTSLVAKAFYESGLFMGDDLMPPSEHNKEGYYEDKGIIHFHNDLLRAMGYSFWDVDDYDTFHARPVPEAFYGRAAALIEEKFSGQVPFGWKDPRATLLLPFWKEVLPSARFVLVYRAPGKVIRSLVRRGDFSKGRPLKLWQGLRALRVGNVYTRALLDFTGQHADSCLLVKSPEDLLNMEGAERINRIVRENWDIDLAPLDFEKVINRKLLTLRSSSWHRQLFFASRLARDYYQQLEARRIKLWQHHENPGLHPKI